MDKLKRYDDLLSLQNKKVIIWSEDSRFNYTMIMTGKLSYFKVNDLIKIEPVENKIKIEIDIEGIVNITFKESLKGIAPFVHDELAEVEAVIQISTI